MAAVVEASFSQSLHAAQRHTRQQHLWAAEGTQSCSSRSAGAVPQRRYPSACNRVNAEAARLRLRLRGWRRASPSRTPPLDPEGPPGGLKKRTIQLNPPCALCPSLSENYHKKLPYLCRKNHDEYYRRCRLDSAGKIHTYILHRIFKITRGIALKMG